MTTRPTSSSSTSPRRSRRPAGSAGGSGSGARAVPAAGPAASRSRGSGAARRLVALAIAVVVGLVFWVGSCQGQSRHDEYASYMDSVQPIAQSSAATGTAFASVWLQKLTLTGLRSKLGLWSRQQQQDYDAALRLVRRRRCRQRTRRCWRRSSCARSGSPASPTLFQAGSKSLSQVAASSPTGQLLSASDVVWAKLFRLPATQTLTRLGVRA